MAYRAVPLTRRHADEFLSHTLFEGTLCLGGMPLYLISQIPSFHQLIENELLDRTGVAIGLLGPNAGCPGADSVKEISQRRVQPGAVANTIEVGILVEIARVRVSSSAKFGWRKRRASASSATSAVCG